jgi:hypothetical protein
MAGHAVGADGMLDFTLPGGDTANGQELALAWGALPGQRFRLQFTSGASGWYKYLLNVSFTHLDDPFEANDDKGGSPLTLGTPGVDIMDFQGKLALGCLSVDARLVIGRRSSADQRPRQPPLDCPEEPRRSQSGHLS